MLLQVVPIHPTVDAGEVQQCMNSESVQNVTTHMVMHYHATAPHGTVLLSTALQYSHMAASS